MMELTTGPDIFLDVLNHVAAAVTGVIGLRWQKKQEDWGVGSRPETGSICCAHQQNAH